MMLWRAYLYLLRTQIQKDIYNQYVIKVQNSKTFTFYPHLTSVNYIDDKSSLKLIRWVIKIRVDI
ncbi:unnamed protein product [Nezara viridula]|uniref:Uncharacterized protein n=1 Tax=Nezara viridula TaxID=85310 RepID=A0A9P0EF12_NEZVI|nr:unnamed protein product [Nezara viridula]